jgi:hypothetical protein
MGEWASYALSDFLLFSPQTYFRQFALINEKTFALAIVFAALALAIAIFAGGSRWNGRVTSTRLAFLWASSAWLFHYESYAEINWAAVWFAFGFGIQALALILAGIFGGFLLPIAPTRQDRIIRALAVLVVLLYPLQAGLFGRSWQEAESVGISPDATAIFTILILALGAGRMRYALAAIPLLWTAISLLTLWTMDAPEFWTLATLLAASLIALTRASAGRERQSGPAPAD